MGKLLSCSNDVLETGFWNTFLPPNQPRNGVFLCLFLKMGCLSFWNMFLPPNQPRNGLIPYLWFKMGYLGFWTRFCPPTSPRTLLCFTPGLCCRGCLELLPSALVLLRPGYPHPPREEFPPNLCGGLWTPPAGGVLCPTSGTGGCTALGRESHGNIQLFPAPGDIAVGLMPLQGSCNDWGLCNTRSPCRLGLAAIQS